LVAGRCRFDRTTGESNLPANASDVVLSTAEIEESEGSLGLEPSEAAK